MWTAIGGLISLAVILATYYVKKRQQTKRQKVVSTMLKEWEKRQKLNEPDAIASHDYERRRRLRILLGKGKDKNPPE